jgi:hypothetical protein
VSYEEYAKRITNLKLSREGFVAFLDILGFSGFVRKNSHDDVIAIYQSFFRPIIDFSLAEVAEQKLGSSKWLKCIEESEDNDLAPKLDNITLNCMTISDSIILSTSGYELTDFITLVATVRNLMARSLYFGFPLRGAIAYGNLTMDGDMYSIDSNIMHHQMLGLPLVEAVGLEKCQNWSGCAIHLSAIDKIGSKIIRLDPMMITLYDVPMKEKNESKCMPVVNWVQGIADNDRPKINSKIIRSAFSAHGKEAPAKIESMINNTIQFFERMSDHPVYKNEMSNDEWWALIEARYKDSVKQKSIHI